MSDSEDFELLGFPEPVDETGLRSRMPIEVLATQFTDQLRAGENPSVADYIERYPLHADTIRDMFPMLQVLEQARRDKESSCFRLNMPERFPFDRLGSCRLLCEIGRGGMGVVFQAVETGTDHLVAVKLLPWRVSVVPEWQARFRKEARTTAQLRHRNIVPVFRYGQEHGYCYYVMQYVNGVGLNQIIDRLSETDGVVYQDEIRAQESRRPSGYRPAEIPEDARLVPLSSDAEEGPSVDGNRRRLTPTSWRAFAQIGIQAAQALKFAHSRNILHNDIKPANLLLDASGRVWVSDFGLSQAIEQEATGENTPQDFQRVMGTLRFMAPERLVGTHDVRSDVYSLGLTLYELLTLQPAFISRNRDLMIRTILEQSPVPPREHRPEVPAGLETIVQNCISRHPTDRYESIDQLLADLLNFTRGQSIRSVRRSAGTGFLSRWSGRRHKEGSAD